MFASYFPLFTSLLMLQMWRGATLSYRYSFKRLIAKPHQGFALSARFHSQLFAKKWPVDDVRSTFVDYFVDKHAHVNYKSSPCVPLSDPTLLFANAGMNQFKPIFVGTVDPTSPLFALKRAVNSQKCIRAGGKHNDLDDVGKDTYHHTFFEMLGTWSFGDYFKREAINWAYDILVNVYKLDPNRIYASYFGGDEAVGLPCDTEARDYWLQYLPSERVLPFDKKANFWEMGDTGPCGPCSEIHYDRIGNRDASAFVNADDPNVIEIWNLVFIQFNREADGSLRSLPNKHIDTGMGLERLTSILQEKSSNYDTDVFMPLFDAIQKVVGGVAYKGLIGDDDAKQNYRDTAYRVVADHLRTLTFSIADGALPSNEGRGYVLRRILRRAVRYGMQTLGATQPGFMSQLIPVVVQQFGGAFSEIIAKEKDVQRVILEEELAFASLLDRGVKYFNDIAQEVTKGGVIPGEKAFYLYDTLGFPIDLTQIMAAEQGLTVDLPQFQNAMETQKERSRQAMKLKRLAGRVALSLGAEQVAYLQSQNISPTLDEFKYTWDKPLSAAVKGIFVGVEQGFVNTYTATSQDSEETIGIILDQSPFYAESGGQVADIGVIEVLNAQGEVVVLEVLDVQTYGGYLLHTCIISDTQGAASGIPWTFNKDNKVTAKVDYQRRRRIAPNHSMTHVLNLALRNVLGESVEQRGSLVSEEKFRFDFTCSKAMNEADLASVENMCNKVIKQRLPVDNKVVPLTDAKSISGLRAVFGEVYPDPVRVLSIGAKINDCLAQPKNTAWAQYSIEFCGGTHISNTAEAEAFVILEETAVAKGIRRISGVTGEAARHAQERSRQLQQAVTDLGVELQRRQHSLTTLEQLLVSLRQRLESEELSQVTQINCRQQLEGFQKTLGNLQKQELAQRVGQVIDEVLKEVQTMVTKQQSQAVFLVPIGSDTKAIKQATEAIRKAAPSLSFLCVSTLAGEDKVTVFASIPDNQQASLKANEWVQSSIQKFGGRGGGKPVNAQGSVAVVAGQNAVSIGEEIRQSAASFLNNASVP